MGDADVLVVWLDLTIEREGVDALHATLSVEERARVARLATDALQRRAVVRLARRREVLGESLGIPPVAVELAADAHGRLVAQAPRGRLVVSSSSSDDVGLLAVASSRQLGADVEATSEVLDAQRFTDRVATPREASALAALDPDERHDTLARLWTRKEAYLKATGEGIGGGVTHVEVPLDKGLWHASFQPLGDGQAWLIYDLACPIAGFAAALVVEAGGSPPEITVTRR
ncbi:MAG TPA: 4'-phosphopantetheinyl transferase superfamily protein [Acidimicrobiales bacterium]|nr:4'-phosphopantetheinyl transferase superfamily protein [Acidimicrobiales bacterium]